MNKTFFYSIVVAVISMFFTACGNAYGQERIYNSEKTFSIIPIKGWINYSEKNGISFAKKRISFTTYRENIGIFPNPANGMTLDELWNSFVIRDFPISFDNYKEIQTGKSNINGMNANWIECTNTFAHSEGYTFRNLVYMFVENDTMYYIICMALDENYKNYEKDFQKMINTFKVEGLNASH
jgi:hypothetical protein